MWAWRCGAIWQDLAQALIDFPWQWMPAVVGLTLLSYTARLFKWQWYLKVVGVQISRFDSARIFGVGMLMVMTPGKAGEFLKSYMVKNVTGTPMSVTAPVILAERMTDGMAMLVLAGAGLFAFPDPTARSIAATVFFSFVAIVVVVQIRPLALWCLGVAEHIPVVKRFAHNLHTLYESSYIIFKPGNLMVSLTIGVFSWGCVGLAYYIVLVGFGAPPGPQTVLVAIFIFNISTVIGAVFAMPGGLGGVEGSMVALSMRILGLTQRHRHGRRAAHPLLHIVDGRGHWRGQLPALAGAAGRIGAGREGASRSQRAGRNSIDQLG